MDSYAKRWQEREFFVSARTLSAVEPAGAGESAEKTGKTGANSAPASSPPLLEQTPDLAVLAHEMDGGTKVFKLIAEPVRRKIAPWKTIDCWGFNGVSPGPAIQAYAGERVRIVLENRLPESLAIHWHGLEIPYAMDGMPYISQKPIVPGAQFAYEFTIHQNGTFFYHSHSPMQQMMGLVGLFILHPQRAHAPVADHDFGIVLQEWAVCCRTTPFRTPRTWNGTG